MSPRLPPQPNLVWDETGAPRAVDFDDIYFSRAGGLDETRAVFFAGCGLPEAWAGRGSFSICELGFGSGLNALATWDAWTKARVSGAVLNFHSIEAFPLAHDDAARALAAFPALAPYTEKLLAVWPVRAYGPQRFWFAEDGFALTLHIGEAAGVLAGMDGAFDAWFLDGFAPARNPGLWSDEVFAQIARLSAPGARAATYSVAGAVRAGLTSAGFAVEKRPGFAGKRGRLEAHLVEPRAQTYSLYPRASARHLGVGRVAVIGAGIAGACVVAALRRRGLDPVMFEAGEATSLSPAALVMPRLERTDTPLARVHQGAYLHALALYGAIDGAFAPIGVRQAPAQDREPDTFAALASDPPLPDDFLRASRDELFHPRAGLVDPLTVLTAFTQGVERHKQRVTALSRYGDHWVLMGEDGSAIMDADCVVLACGAGLGRFAQFLPLRYSRGQIDWAPLAGEKPAHAISSGGYAAPFADGVLFGATFDRVAPDAAMAISEISTEENLATLEGIAPDLFARIDQTRLHARAAMRVSSPDVAPICGLLPDPAVWKQRYAGLAQGARFDLSAPPPAQDGFYVLGALGARGFLLAPFLGEELAGEICGEPSMMDSGARAAIHPTRFLERGLKRGSAA